MARVAPCKVDRNAGFEAEIWLTKSVVWACVRRSSRVVTTEIPTLPPIFRARFIKPEAALFFSRGRKAYAAVLMGTNRKAIPTALMTRARAGGRKYICRSE